MKKERLPIHLSLEEEKEFKKEMATLLSRTEKEVKGFRPIRFRQMISQHGDVKATELVANKERALEGFIMLLENGRQDLSVETLVLDPKYMNAFSCDAIKNSKDRLEWEKNKEYHEQEFKLKQLKTKKG